MTEVKITCPDCGAGVDVDDQFCADCGTDLEAEPADDETAPCAACDEPISLEATTCPECGNNPANKAKWASVALMFAGFVLSLTGIGAIIGIPLFLVGLVGRLGIGRADYRPTEHAF